MDGWMLKVFRVDERRDEGEGDVVEVGKSPGVLLVTAMFTVLNLPT